MIFFKIKLFFSPRGIWIWVQLVGFALLYSMSYPESPAPAYLFSFVILWRLSVRYFIRVCFLCASSFWKLRFNFVWQLGPTAQPLSALQTLSAHQRGCGEGKLPLSWDNALTQKNVLGITLQSTVTICPLQMCAFIHHHLLAQLPCEALMGYFLPPFTAPPLRLAKALSLNPGTSFSSSACLSWCAFIHPANKGSLLHKEIWFYLLQAILSHLFDF